MRLPILLLITAACLTGCNSEAPSLEFTIDDYGLAFGNSDVTHGVRLNAIDAGPSEVDGFNFTIARPRNVDALVVNGLSVGLWRPDAYVQRGVSIGPLVAGDHLTGLQLGLLGAASRSTMRGLNAAVIQTRAEDELFGINIAALVGGGGNIGPINIAALAISPVRMSDLTPGIAAPPRWGRLWGLSIGGVRVDYREICGITLSGMIRAQDLTGFSAAYMYSEVDGVATGLQIAPFTSARNLHGVQLGFINHVWSNPVWFRWLPIMNFGMDRDP